MAKYCTMYSGNSSHGVKECLEEYSLENKVEALKNLLNYNAKACKSETSITNASRKTKHISGIKECLRPQELTPFQTLVSELRNTVMDSYWNKEVGKPRYQVPHLPVGINLLETTFGIKRKSQETMAELLMPLKDDTGAVIADSEHILYQKSHNSYYPSEQITRNYNDAFNKEAWFGKRSKADFDGVKTKRVLSWINNDSLTLVNSCQADFLERTQASVGVTKNPKAGRVFENIRHGKHTRNEMQTVSDTLRDCAVSKETQLQQKCLQYLNKLRQQLKKRVPPVPFFDIHQKLICLDTAYANVLPKETVFNVLQNHHIYLDYQFLDPILNALKVYKEENVEYKILVDLINWKCNIPALPKLNTMSPECQYYISTYSNTIGNIQDVDTSNIPVAGIPSKKSELLQKTTEKNENS